MDPNELALWARQSITFENTAVVYALLAIVAALQELKDSK